MQLFAVALALRRRKCTSFFSEARSNGLTAR
jgi:hypothetical protein